MEHRFRLGASTLITDDRYPGYGLIHPFPGLYIPALVDGQQATPCPAYGERSATFWFSNATDAWAFVEWRENSPIAPRKS